MKTASRLALAKAAVKAARTVDEKRAAEEQVLSIACELATRKGRGAFFTGQHRSNNPYANPERREAWDGGWMEAWGEDFCDGGDDYLSPRQY